MSDFMQGFSPTDHHLPETEITRRASGIVHMACVLVGDGRRAYNFHDSERGVMYNVSDDCGWVSAHLLEYDVLDTLTDAAIVAQLVRVWSQPDKGEKA